MEQRIDCERSTRAKLVLLHIMSACVPLHLQVASYPVRGRFNFSELEVGLAI